MNVNFKPATVADLELLVGFMRALYAHDEIAFNEAIARRATVELLNDETKGRVWLVEADGEQVGYVVLTYGYSLEFHGRDALVDELFLTETARGRGLGRRGLNTRPLLVGKQSGARHTESRSRALRPSSAAAAIRPGSEELDLTSGAWRYCYPLKAG